MTARKSERLLNLLIMLLVARRPLTKEQIQQVIYDGESGDGFERKFDRDKEELRSIGVPLELEGLDTFFDDEPGYRIRPEEWQLPTLDLAADEAAVIGLATKVWEHARLAGATSLAVAKLSAAGLDSDLAALDVVEPRLDAEEPSFDAFLDAVQARQPLRFDYRASSGGETTTRRVQPWGMVHTRGRWYAVGLDTDRGEERVFRLSRVVGQPRPDGRPGAYTVPDGLDLGSVVARLSPPAATGAVTLLIREGTALALRRRGQLVDSHLTGPDGSPDWDRVRIDNSEPIADDVLSHGPDVYVEGPEALREEIVQRLTRLGERG
ncbi:helix-turn-helix transcriptional regulator [Nocardioides limicola]|uniref:helix-turn-helix transcriptional regulator n=1 Tax=Nocardioides limicola TaxID=2803368 RepID=UPI00193C4043|nr:WYL domain-containing protein [Nocardioides sp. DJM-14]